MGSQGALRAPPVLASGAGWLVEAAIEREPVAGARAIDAVAVALCRLMETELPDAPPRSRARSSRAARLRRALRLVRSPLSVGDVMRARRMLAGLRLPLRQSHGDLHPGNILLSGGIPWLVDWELTARRPAGFDLVTLWPLVAAASDRERLFEAAVAHVGEEWRGALEQLRYAVFVGTVGGMFSADQRFNRQPEIARGLLGLLGEVRR